ncbi:MAG: DUF523 domain-containing protein [Collinsella sp.]
MKIAVSACLLGENCKYSGGNNRSERLLSELAKHPEIEIIPVCPEVAGGLPTPRPPAEIVDGEVVNNCGVSVDAEYRAGVAAEIARLKPHIESGELAAAVLQSRSPSCGVHGCTMARSPVASLPGTACSPKRLQSPTLH